MPLVAGMEHIATNAQPDVTVLKTVIGDTFKILCQNVIRTNSDRRDCIKNELQPKFRSICDTPASATGLFGDTLSEDLKKLDTRTLHITTKQPFLGKGGFKPQQKPKHGNHGPVRQGFHGGKTTARPYQGSGKSSSRSGKRSEKFGQSKKPVDKQ